MSVMKTSLTIFPCVLGSAFLYIRVCPGLSFAKDWATLLHFIYFIYLLPVTIYLIIKLSVTYNFSACRENLTENPYHFLPLLVGFDTLTYCKDYGRSPTLVGHQRPVYYTSEVLIESKQRYPHWQKLVYGFFMASRKLKQYFQGHPIIVVNSAPLGDIIQNREVTGRVARCAIKPGPHGLKYMPRTAIKYQALVDFINDWTELQVPEDRPDNTYWTIHFEWFLLPLEVTNFVMFSA